MGLFDKKDRATEEQIEKQVNTDQKDTTDELDVEQLEQVAGGAILMKPMNDFGRRK